MATKQPPRAPLSSDVEAQVLDLSRRRCALCFHLDGYDKQKKGQIAHLDRRRSESSQDNLVFLCLDHHSEYDSTTRQHKNFTIAEVRDARTKLHEWVAKAFPSNSSKPGFVERGKGSSAPHLAPLPGVVRFRRGDIFEVGSDLTVLPCSARGHFSKTAERHIRLFDLPLPPDQPLGSITVFPFPGPGSVTRYIAWAASVMAHQSTADTIGSIGRQLGSYASAHPDIRFIEAPLLGTGAGDLDEMVAGEALREGFLATCRSTATLTIFGQPSGVIRRLQKAADDGENAHSQATAVAATEFCAGDVSSVRLPMRDVSKVIFLIKAVADDGTALLLTTFSADWKTSLFPSATLPSESGNSTVHLRLLLSQRLRVPEKSIHLRIDPSDDTMKSHTQKVTGDKQKRQRHGTFARYHFVYCIVGIDRPPKRILSRSFVSNEVRFEWVSLNALKSDPKVRKSNYDVLEFISQRFDQTTILLPSAFAERIRAK